MEFWRLGVSCRSLKTISLITTFVLLKTVLAGPYPKDDLHDTGYSYLQDRSCVSYCGAQNQYCCAAGEACYTNQANIAYCSVGSGDVWGGYAVYTTTYTETNLILRTSTYTSSWVIATSTCQPDPAITQSPVCTSSLGQSSCGSICCAKDQRCAFENSCTAYTATGDESTTQTTYYAPFRPTSGDTSTQSATTTVPFQPPATASGSIFPTLPLNDNPRLSGGAIAGIVIGALLFAKKKTSSNAGDSSSAPEMSNARRTMLVGGGILAAVLVFFGLRQRERPPSTSSSSGSSIGSSSSSDSDSQSSDSQSSSRSNQRSNSRTRDIA
ncbi:hypothetical protein EPUL_001532, partial [Erysiphe pulchra]